MHKLHHPAAAKDNHRPASKNWKQKILAGALIVAPVFACIPHVEAVPAPKVQTPRDNAMLLDMLSATGQYAEDGMDVPDLVPPLFAALSSESCAVRAEAAKALSKAYAHPESRKVITAELKNVSDECTRYNITNDPADINNGSDGDGSAENPFAIKLCTARQVCSGFGSINVQVPLEVVLSDPGPRTNTIKFNFKVDLTLSQVKMDVGESVGRELRLRIKAAIRNTTNGRYLKYDADVGSFIQRVRSVMLETDLRIRKYLGTLDAHQDMLISENVRPDPSRVTVSDGLSVVGAHLLSKDTRASHGAAEAIARLSSLNSKVLMAILPSILDGLRHGDGYVQTAMAETLMNLTKARDLRISLAIPYLVEALNNSNTYVALAAVNALENTGSLAYPYLLHAIQGKKETQGACEALKKIQYRSGMGLPQIAVVKCISTSQLIDSLGDDDPVNRFGAVQLMEMRLDFGVPASELRDAVPLLINFLTEETPSLAEEDTLKMRQRVIWLLGMIGDEKAIPTLTWVKENDADMRVRKEAESSINTILSPGSD